MLLGFGLRKFALGRFQLLFRPLPVFFGLAFWLALVFPNLLGDGGDFIMREGFVLLGHGSFGFQGESKKCLATDVCFLRSFAREEH